MVNMSRDTSERVSSIPSKYKIVKISNSERKGFSSQTKRFPSQPTLTENPGPGSYNYFSSSEVNSPSFSAKGTTGFVPSKAPRALTQPQRHIPGPNTYNLQSSFINKYDFNTGVSRVFRRPVAVEQDGPKTRYPAPNQYDIHYGSGERYGSSVGSSFFLSKTKRDAYDLNKDMPSPCQYNVEDDCRRVSKAVLSPFKSRTQRITGLLDNHVPGPGAYSPHQAPVPVRKTTLVRRSGLTISAPPLIVPKPPPNPGPAHYNVTRNVLSKQIVPTAAFASKSDRHSHLNKTDSPGPGFYDPHLSTKQSFFYNDSRIWLPV